jgi:hypothetical protein
LREQSEAAERRKDEEVDEKDDDEDDDEEEAEEEAAGGDDEGDDGDDDSPKKKKKKKVVKKKAAPKAKAPTRRTRTPKVVRMKVVWAVYSNSHTVVEEFPYPNKADAEAFLAKITADKKSGAPFFLQPLKKPFDKE